MPFPAIPYQKTQETKKLLRERWNIPTMPRVVLVDAKTGTLINDEARYLIEQRKTDGFPWQGEKAETKMVQIEMNSKV